MKKDDDNTPSGQGANKQRQQRTYGRIPNSVVHDRRLSDDALALLAYRLTKVGNYALSVDAAAKGLPLADGSKGRKIGKKKFKRLIRELTDLGYLERRQPPSRGRSSFRYAEEIVNVPQGQLGERICRECWHDGSLTDKAIAGLLFIRAHAHNCPVHPAALRGRFGWGKGRSLKVLRELLQAGLIVQVLGAQTAYLDAEVNRGFAPQCPNGIKTSHERLSHEKPSSDRSSHTHTDRTSQKDQRHESDPLTLKDYGFVAKATKPESFPDNRRPPNETVSLLDDPWKSERILGWGDGDLKRRLGLDELSHDTLGEVEAIASDDQIIEMLRVATKGQVHSDILSPAGARAIRLLASVLVEEQGCSAQAALDEIRRYIQTRIGDRSDGLNSLRLVAVRIVGSVAGGEQGLVSDVRAILDELRAYDVNQIIDPSLFKQTGRFKRLLMEYGDQSVDAVRSAIATAVIDGKDAFSIKTWDYFRRVLEEARLKDEMADGGIRPGDVFGLHRDLSERDEPD